MKILIIYGGSGLADDLSLAAVKRIHTVLNELEVEVKQYNLENTDITEEITNELQSTKGVVLATTVEWMGIGGRMQTFLDQCYAYNNQYFNDKYLMSVILTKTNGDRDASNYILKCWDMLGGLEGVNVCGKIDRFVELETNEEIISVIDKKTEDFYRIIRQKRNVLPTGTENFSKPVIDQHIDDDVFAKMNIIDEYVGDTKTKAKIIEEDPYIVEQRQDIEEISDFLKQQLNKNTNLSGNKYIDRFLEAFICEDSSFTCTYNIIIINQKNKDIILKVKDKKLAGFIGTDVKADVIINVEANTLDEIIKGKLTVQRGFLTGKLKAKGNFTLLYEFDNIFKFTDF
ncbi:SCP2 sterol-binding domain-containing protein [Vallitalea longa]|nr:SCP2 sterol-binding domain-containing protein [Vallitalea longa]